MVSQSSAMHTIHSLSPTARERGSEPTINVDPDVVGSYGTRNIVGIGIMVLGATDRLYCIVSV